LILIIVYFAISFFGQCVR